MRYKAILIPALLIGVAVIILAQFSIPTLFGADGYLHIRMAKFINEFGPRYDFHWARYSTFAGHFADKDFLYHVFLIPFALLPNIFLGAKIFACVSAIFLYLAFFFLLLRYSNKWLIPVFLFALLCSDRFLWSISEPRNMILAIAMTLLCIHFVIQKRQLALFLLTLVYALSHVSAPLLLIFALICESIRLMSEKQFIWKSILAVLLGLIAGYLLHPNFPNNLSVFYLNGILVPLFALKWGLELGAEFFPIDTRSFILSFPFIVLGLLLLIASATASGERKIKGSSKIWLGCAGFYFVFAFFSLRYIIHAYPLILIALASYFSDWLANATSLSWLRRDGAARLWLYPVIAVVLISLGFGTYKNFFQLARSSFAYNSHYEAAGRWMSENIPPGEVVFHANWSDSQYFIGLNPKNDYFVTFDPIYMYYWNPEKYRIYRDIAFGRAKDPYSLLSREFSVRYGYAGKNYFGGLIQQIRSDARFEVLAEDSLGLIFRLKPPLQ